MLAKYLTPVLLLILLSGCASTSPDHSFLADIHDYRPASILIVPVRNETIDVLAPTTVLATLPTTLAERGYYVFPVNTVKTILRAEGLYEAAEIHALPTETLASLFTADAVLYVRIHEWDARYILLSTSTVIDIEYQLKGRHGEPLWHARQQLTYEPEQEDQGSLLGNLVAGAIAAAFERASPNFLPLTREAHHNAINNQVRGLPPGPLHRAHDGYYQKLSEQD